MARSLRSDPRVRLSIVNPAPLARGFAGYSARWLGADLLAGLTLAAVAIPEQMATARLAGLPPRFGFVAFIAGSLAFAAWGRSRRLSVGADSTITAIFAGALALMANSGSPRYAALAAALAILVGLLVAGAGVLRLGWIGNLLSIPVTTGFLLGVAVHIVVSQAPAALGVATPAGDLPEQLTTMVGQAGSARPAAMLIAGGVLLVSAVCHRISPRLPGVLLAVLLAVAAASAFGLARSGLATVGAVAGGAPALGLPGCGPADLVALAPLALLVCLVIIAQTAATARAFPDGEAAPEIDGDLIGVGLGGVAAGLFGAFPINASPPRTAVVAESGGRSPLAGVAAAGVAVAALLWGGAWLGRIPQAALAGVLLFVAARLVRLKDIIAIGRVTLAEGGLILATAAAIVLLPIASGVAVGVTLSLLHGVWSNARVRVTPLRRIPGSTVWWPPVPGRPDRGERLAGVAVLGFPAPLTFVNAETFARAFLDQALGDGGPAATLVVFETAGLVELDYTGAQALRRVVIACREGGAAFAVARLESPAAQAAFARFGLLALIGADHIFETVAGAVAALAPDARPLPSTTDPALESAPTL